MMEGEEEEHIYESPKTQKGNTLLAFRYIQIWTEILYEREMAHKETIKPELLYMRKNNNFIRIPKKLS